VVLLVLLLLAGILVLGHLLSLPDSWPANSSSAGDSSADDNDDRTMLPAPGRAHKPFVCVLARTYAAQYSATVPFYQSLLDTGYAADMHVVLAPTDYSLPRSAWQSLVNLLNRKYHSKVISLSPFLPGEAQKYKHLLPANDYGYVLTDQLLEYLRKNSTEVIPGRVCDYFLVTNSDNLYLPPVFDEALPHMRAQQDVSSYIPASNNRSSFAVDRL
jgi:hypothetical protein